ncbi:hypothetical protein [Fictibacillus terranigra]|uniref:Uncharacterized protein n=1 Tax=Fictibacillus terranigra TaxID=3058424 RepID=A0ABT8E8B5_9BACL|nr:hypothetical protein [Fictibacillus sp. CENA-BCM004]MDN4074162.1 hypothetical protein [Fictibacillus sp. CENA-BCM004]
MKLAVLIIILKNDQLFAPAFIFYLPDAFASFGSLGRRLIAGIIAIFMVKTKRTADGRSFVRKQKDIVFVY